MTTHITIIGSIKVGPGAEADFIDLIDAFDPDSRDTVELVDGVLVISLEDAEVPYGYIEPVIKALDAFCTKHATEGALFDYGDGDHLFLGPTPAAKRKAHIDLLAYEIVQLRVQIGAAMKRPDDKYSSPFHPL